MTVLNLLLFLLFQDLLHFRDDLRKHLIRFFTPHQAPLAGHKKCDYLLFPQSLRLLHPSRLHRLRHIINLLTFLNRVAILFRLLSHLVCFLYL
jgi:hypothetical protein